MHTRICSNTCRCIARGSERSHDHHSSKSPLTFHTILAGVSWPRLVGSSLVPLLTLHAPALGPAWEPATACPLVARLSAAVRLLVVPADPVALAGCSVIEVGSDRFKVPEILFHPAPILKVPPPPSAPRPPLSPAQPPQPWHECGPVPWATSPRAAPFSLAGVVCRAWRGARSWAWRWGRRWRAWRRWWWRA
jgi:hypothetical protein